MLEEVVRYRQQLGRRIRRGLQWGLSRPLVRTILVSRPVRQPVLL